MRVKKWITVSSLVMCLPFLGCSNVLESMASKNTDAALLEDARKAMNSQDWDLAIEKFEGMTDSGKASHTTIEQWAYAYAGKCGLNFINYFNQLSEASLTGTTLFAYLMNAWTGVTVYPSYCTLAQTKMEEISADAGNRSSNQNLLAILALVKIGVYLRTNLDRDGTDGLGDGTAELNPCTDDPGNLLEDQATEIVTGFGLLTTNLIYLTAVLGSGSISNSLDTVNTVCRDYMPGACGRTDPDDVTDADRDAIRDLLKTSSGNTTAPLGVGNCVDPMVAPCC